MSKLNASIERFEAAMARLEQAVDGWDGRRADSAGAEHPVAQALRVAEAEVTRLRLENDALRAVGAAAEETVLSRYETALTAASEEGDAAAEGPETDLAAIEDETPHVVRRRG